jgi:hypothetical protein
MWNNGSIVVSIGLVTGWVIGVRILSGARFFSVLHNVETAAGPPRFIFYGCWTPSLGIKLTFNFTPTMCLHFVYKDKFALLVLNDDKVQIFI